MLLLTPQVPEVEKCCVVGVRNKKHKVGQLAVAYVKSSEGHKEMEKRIFAVCPDSLPDYSIPAKILFIREFPYTPAFKVDFKRLEEMADK